MSNRQSKRSPNVIIRGQAVDDFIQMVVNAWAVEYPERAASYRELIKKEYENLFKPSGVSKEGNLAYTGHIPAELFYVIEAHHYGFFNSPDNMNRFYKVVMGQYRPQCKNNFHYIDRRNDRE